MLKREKRFEFRKRLSEVYKLDVRNYEILKSDTEYEISDGSVISIPENSGEVLVTAARDFCDFLFCSINISARFTKKSGGDISIIIDESYGEYKAFRLDVAENGIKITAHDERGAAQALFFLEDEMLNNSAPFIGFGVTERVPKFSPRMTHLGYALDEFPDSHLAQIAHAGMDAILVMVRSNDYSLHGYADFNDLIRRAKKWGLDVYAYSYFRSLKHPDDADADAHYESTYGALFRHCPEFKGVVLVGESIGFPSKDENASPLPYDANYINGIPQDKPSADFWPCLDYSDWLKKLQSIIYKYNPSADIVFWSYNWGHTPEKNRCELIKRLPKGVSLLVTFETCGHEKTPDGRLEMVYDYTIAVPGPGNYFLSEAKAAKENGVRLYAMTNTAGLTWDMGGIPYEPVPYAWYNRAKAVVEAHEKYGLSGLMESHQYGFTPSVISDMMKYLYDTDGKNFETELFSIIKRRFGKTSVEVVNSAFKKWSEAITYLPHTGEDQVGAFRVGPSFPFSISGTFKPAPDNTAISDFMSPKYPYINSEQVGIAATVGVRLPFEIKALEKMYSLLIEGIELLECITDKNNELEYLINLGKYMACAVVTGKNAKRWHIATTSLQIESDNNRVGEIIAEIDNIISAERKNVMTTIPLLKLDSRLGWDPRLGYIADENKLLWKLKLLDYVEKTEMKLYRESYEFYKNS